MNIHLFQSENLQIPDIYTPKLASTFITQELYILHTIMLRSQCKHSSEKSLGTIHFWLVEEVTQQTEGHYVYYS